MSMHQTSPSRLPVFEFDSSGSDDSSVFGDAAGRVFSGERAPSYSPAYSPAPETTPAEVLELPDYASRASSPGYVPRYVTPEPPCESVRLPSRVCDCVFFGHGKF
jgi:hypothetical protein